MNIRIMDIEEAVRKVLEAHEHERYANFNLLFDVAHSPISDNREKYVEVQIDRDLWNKIQNKSKGL